jgi:hypothetical protein
MAFSARERASLLGNSSFSHPAERGRGREARPGFPVAHWRWPLRDPSGSLRAISFLRFSVAARGRAAPPRRTARSASSRASHSGSGFAGPTSKDPWILHLQGAGRGMSPSFGRSGPLANGGRASRSVGPRTKEVEGRIVRNAL